MRIHVSVVLFVLQLALAAKAAAQEAPAAPAAPDTLSARVTTLARPDQQYSLYLPPGYDVARRWPVLVILDARGRATETAELAMPGARRNGWIVLSSYQSRSDVGESATLLALQSLLREVGQRYAHDPRRIYVAGFSGTAKTLWTQVTPLHALLAGVLGNGGARPPDLGPLRQPPSAFFGIAGNADFNYQEMRDQDEALARLGATRRLDVFEGPHGWPDATAFALALDWFDLVAMQQGRMPRDEPWIDARLAADRARAAAAPDALERWRRLDQLVRDFHGLRDVAGERGEAARLLASPGLGQQRARETRLRSDERRSDERLDAWILQVAQRRVDGRATEPPSAPTALRELRIPRLKQAAAGADPLGAASARRRLERMFVATSFYLPNRFQQLGDTARAIAMLEIATAIAPERGAPYWRLAQLHAQAGDRDDAFQALAAARERGTVDADDLRDNPAWQSLRGDPRWAAWQAGRSIP
jgi:predicted esterase